LISRIKSVAPAPQPTQEEPSPPDLGTFTNDNIPNCDNPNGNIPYGKFPNGKFSNGNISNVQLQITIF